jgi:hypothetical protein
MNGRVVVAGGDSGTMIVLGFIGLSIVGLPKLSCFC